MKVYLEEGAVMPSRAHATDAGLDLYSRETTGIPEHGSWSFDTGVHIQLPKDTCGLLVSKSGLNVKYDVTSTGLIDEGYTGSIIVKLYNNSDKPYLVRTGDKITQLVVLPIVKEELEQVESLEVTDRGNNGFGSTGL